MADESTASSSSNPFGGVRLKPAETKVKIAQGNERKLQVREPAPTVQSKYTGPTQVILIISKHWVVQEWLQDNPGIKKVSGANVDADVDNTFLHQVSI